MTSLVEKALQTITNSVNLKTGLIHSNDMQKAKEMFVRLHKAGEILLDGEISSWAVQNNCLEEDAKEHGSLAEQIGRGKKVRIGRPSCWKDDILEKLSAKL